MKILKFEQPWCSGCKAQDVILKHYTKGDVCPIEHIDVTKEENDELVNKFNIKNLPTMILINNKNELVHTFNGVTQVEVIESYIN
jgi:Thioredoxin.